MKSSLTILLLLISVVSFAQDSERAEVEKALNAYMQGGTTNNYELLSSAFHKDATMKWMAKEGYAEVNALEFFKSRMKPGPDQERETRIVHLDITGSAAHAKLELRYDGFSFIDYMSLLKINGE